MEAFEQQLAAVATVAGAEGEQVVKGDADVEGRDEAPVVSRVRVGADVARRLLKRWQVRDCGWGEENYMLCSAAARSV